MSSKKRKRSEVSEASSEELSTVSTKRSREIEWTVPRDINTETELCDKLLNFLRKYKDPTDSCISEHLLRVPSRRSQPNYYDVISNPIDLLRIQQKQKTDCYKTVQDFLNDVRLLFTNTKTFYSPSTDEHKAAVTLESVFLAHLQEFGFSAPSQPASPVSSLTLRIPKVQLPSLHAPLTRGQRSSSSSESSVSTNKSAAASSKLLLAQPQTSKASTSTKGTRSRAWIDDYLSSDDPLKMYIALVYNYHDSSGEYVAEVFHSLPSRKEYPEYYRIITEPLDLNIIQRNVNNGHYHGLKALQEDLILMVKNAHYFNEPGSVLYKKASMMRKFIINKGAELWRKFQLGQMPQALHRADSLTGSDGEGESRKVPKLSIKKSGEGMRVQRRGSQLSSELEESQSESSEEELSSEEEVGDKQKLMLHIKTEKLAGRTPSNPLTKLLKAKRAPALYKILMTIYRCLVTQTDQGRHICELFKKRPSAKMYPEYYIVIKQPIDLREIHDKIRNEAYPSVEGLMEDIELLVNNACTFNEEDSLVYADALVLRETTQETVEQIYLKWPELAPSSHAAKSKKVSTSIKGPGLKTKVETPKDVLDLYDTVKEYVDKTGRSLWKTFEKIPQASTPSDSAQLKKPLDSTVVQDRFTHGHYLSVDSLLDDLTILFDTAYCGSSAESPLSKDSIELHRATIKKYQELRAAEREANPSLNVQDCVKKLLKEIVTKTLTYQDASGHCPADSLMSLEAIEEFQHPDLQDTAVQRTLTLNQINEWTGQGQYSRLDQLQRDLLLVLSEGRGGEFDSPTYQNAVAVERRWIHIRDEVCKKGSLLWSPALSHTLSTLDAQLALEKKAARSSPTPDPTITSPGVGVGVASGRVPVTGCDEGAVVDKRNVEYVGEWECDGVTYRVGDVVYVRARAENDREPHIVLVESLWRDKTGTMWLDGWWFYRPVETFHPAARKFFEKEVFKSDFHSIAKLSSVTGRCGVLPLKDYTKYRLEGIADEDTFVCESRYASKTKSFKKIKVWSLPGTQPRLLPRDKPLLLHKVPSVFAPTDKQGVGEAMEVDVVGDTSGIGEGSGDGSLMEDEGEQLKLSFSAQLKNVIARAPNPELNHTYYEQYCIDGDHFRLGDFVFLRSDQELPFIARIEKMWTDANDDPWIYGPWFIRPDDVTHTPTRVFFEKELFLSNIHDTNPMRSICGRCSVITSTDYCKKRSTQYLEEEVFITESRYNESEKKIIKMRGLKQFPLSDSTTRDEVYHFSKDITPVKIPSPKLFSKEYKLVPSPIESKEEFQASTPGPSSTVTSTVQAVKKQPNIISLNPQLVQQLLASASKKLVMTPKVPVPLSTLPPSLTSTSNSSAPSLQIQPKQSSMLKAQTCVCQWSDCGKAFANILDLGSHLLTIGVHIIADEQGNYHCKWKGCHRNGGKPFNSLSKLTRHLREVHLLKISNSLLGLQFSPLTGGAIAAASSIATLATPTNLTPSTPTPTPTPKPHTTLTVSSTPSTQTLPLSSTPTIGQPVQTPSKASTVPASTQAATSIFHPPPENRQHISHSAIYMKYIRGLQTKSTSMSSYKQSIEVRPTAKPPGPIRPSDWLGPDAIASAKDNKSIADALWKLRDHLLKESSKLERFSRSMM